MAGVALVNRLAPARFLSGYYSAEQFFVDHFPTDSHRRDIEKLSPYLIRWGILRPARIEVEGISLLLDPSDLVALDILRGGPWQPEIWNSLSPSLSEGAVMLDVGAHIGTFTFKGAKAVGKQGRVVAFEPNPETLKLLRDNVAANHADNVTIAPVACTDREQTLHFYAAPIVNTGASSLARDNASVSLTEAPREYTVQGRPIDAVVEELKLARVDAIKVDIEGAETSAMRGASQTLRRFHPVIAIEVVRRQLHNMGTSPEELAQVFLAAGYNHARPLNPTRTDWEWKKVDAENLLSSLTVADPATTGQLLSGFHGVDDETTERTEDKDISVRLKSPASVGQWVTLKFDTSSEVAITAEAGAAKLPAQKFAAGTNVEYRQQVPAANTPTIDVIFHATVPVTVKEISLAAK